jgi:methyl-accepting chemotaxis protein
LTDTGTRAVGIEAPEHIAETVIGRGEVYKGQIEIYGMPYIVYYFPLNGWDGNPVGMFSISVSNARTVASANMLLTILIIISVIGLTVAVFAVLRIANGISKPLGLLDEAMQLTAKYGDITCSEEETSVHDKNSVRSDEVGSLYRSFADIVAYMNATCDDLNVIANGNLDININIRDDKDLLNLGLKKMVDNLNGMFGEIHTTSAQVSFGAQQISNGAQALANGSSHQAATIQQLSASTSEISEKTKTNAQMAGRAATLASTIKINAEKGSHQMDEMVAAVSEISEASQNISKVIKAIDDIAFQTNILALNAAVEAARAGQHGKGFAVVAEEVRTLAAKSAEAAKDTGALISNSIEKAEYGAKIAESTAESLAEIVSGINESTEIIGEIANASEAQTTGILQINSGIDQVAEIVQQNSATAEKSAETSVELRAQTATLESLIGRFKLSEKIGYRQLPARPSAATSRDKPQNQL